MAVFRGVKVKSTPLETMSSTCLQISIRLTSKKGTVCVELTVGAKVDCERINVDVQAPAENSRVGKFK